MAVIGNNILSAAQREVILEVAASHGAVNVRLFGSRTRENTRRESDIDLLVDMQPGQSLLDLIAIEQDLKDRLDVRVDVLTEAGLSPYIREQVLHEAVPL